MNTSLISFSIFVSFFFKDIFKGAKEPVYINEMQKLMYAFSGDTLHEVILREKRRKT